MSSLYEINEAIMNCVDMETGEVLDAEALEALEMERDSKIESVALWVKNLKAEAAAVASEAKALTERKQRLERKAESIENWLAGVLNGVKFTTPRVVCSWRKSSAVVIDDEDKLIDYAAMVMPEAIDHKVTVKKAAMKEALKDGHQIPFCHMEDRNCMSIK